MRWIDRQGETLPLDTVFAAHLRVVRQRVGVATSRVLHERSQRQADRERPVMLIRDHAGTRQIEGVEGALCDPSSWHLF
jgi:hypothetical protein